MKKSWIVIIVIILLILAGGYYWIYSISKSPAVTSSIPTATSTGSSISSSTPIYKVSDLLAGAPFYQTSSITNSSTGVVISFGNFKPSNSSNGLASVYVNGKIISNSQVGGVVLAQSNFSPDNKYFGMLFNQESGATQYSFEFDVISLTDQTNTLIKVPLPPQTYSGNASQFAPESVTLRPASFIWNSDDTLDITTYFIGTIYKEQANSIIFYQISPTNVWNYNLGTHSYTLLKVLSESSSTAK